MEQNVPARPSHTFPLHPPKKRKFFHSTNVLKISPLRLALKFSQKKDEIFLPKNLENSKKARNFAPQLRGKHLRKQKTP